MSGDKKQSSCFSNHKPALIFPVQIKQNQKNGAGIGPLWVTTPLFAWTLYRKKHLKW